MIITIDGYAGTGKSTAARQLAQALGFTVLNTGAMYRIVGCVLRQNQVRIEPEPRDVERIRQTTEALRFEFPPGQCLANQVDYAEAILHPNAGADASLVAKFPEVRRHLQAEQRRLAHGLNMVTEGRDMGTVVFPDAAIKFFFTCSAEVRAYRRFLMLREQGIVTDEGELQAGILARDHQDETRAIDPLHAAETAHRIDTSAATEAEVLAELLAIVNRCRLTAP
ncbi:MAG: (d)CMP kinase [Gemmataceae bacterium]